MALARKCDRCGKLYVPESRIIKEAGGRVNAIRLMDISYRDGFNNSDRKLYDLCPDCLYELQKWLYGEEGKSDA